MEVISQAHRQRTSMWLFVSTRQLHLWTACQPAITARSCQINSAKRLFQTYPGATKYLQANQAGAWLWADEPAGFERHFLRRSYLWRSTRHWSLFSPVNRVHFDSKKLCLMNQEDFGYFKHQKMNTMDRNAEQKLGFFRIHDAADFRRIREDGMHLVVVAIKEVRTHYFHFNSTSNLFTSWKHFLPCYQQLQTRACCLERWLAPSYFTRKQNFRDRTVRTEKC